MLEGFANGDFSAWKAEIDRAAERIGPWIRRTPLIFARSLAAEMDRPVYLKLECLQVTGSFKIRPALNGILADLAAARAHGIVCSSSGNFGAAAAFAARTLGIAAVIVAAPNTSGMKMDLIRGFGAEVVFCDADYASRQKTVDRLKAERGLFEIHPHSSIETIAGDGTVGREIIEQLPDVRTIILPTSGGGLAAGAALGAKAANPAVRIHLVQSSGNPAMALSFAAHERRTVSSAKTIADGLVATTPGELPFRIIERLAESVDLVDDPDLIAAMKRIFADERVYVEPSGAAPVAALREAKRRGDPGPIVCVLSGGNIDPGKWAAFHAGSPGT